MLRTILVITYSGKKANAMKHDDLDQVTDPKILYDLGFTDKTLIKTENIINNIDHSFDNKPYSVIIDSSTDDLTP
jgi:hypothetical protein